MSTGQNEPQESSTPPSPAILVAIGASAGGLSALENLFANLPAGTSLAFLIIQHSDPDTKSELKNLLEGYTSLGVLEIEEEMPIEADHIYIHPPDKTIEIREGKFFLKTMKSRNGTPKVIDLAFREVAQSYGAHSVGIVLSGAGSDGTSGIQDIKLMQGMVLIQQPEQAEYDTMPRSAIDTGLADAVLPLEEMGEVLISFQEKMLPKRAQTDPDPDYELKKFLPSIYAMIKQVTGHDFSDYKINTIRRRIDRRMAVYKLTRLADYHQYLQENREEIRQLFRELLISVTDFFRDAEAFEVLQEKVIRRIFEEREDPDFSIRIWIPGCATGEEAYSVAILVDECLQDYPKPEEIQIFATDIDERAIEHARRGVFPESIADHISAKRLKDYFIREENVFRIKKHIRKMVIFAPHNIIKDPPFSRLDLICCRNLLIYLQSQVQKEILALFYHILKEKSYLFLGPSESVEDFSSYFEPINRKYKIFKHHKARAHKGPAYPRFPLNEYNLESDKIIEHSPTKKSVLKTVAEKAILRHSTHPCVVLDEENQIVYFAGDTEPFLSPAAGEATMDIFKMARLKIYPPLEVLLRGAKQKQATLSKENIQVTHHQEQILFDLIVRPLQEVKELGQFYLVIFKEKSRSTLSQPQKKQEEEVSDPYTEALRAELHSTKEYLQSTIEELQTSNEDLKATNEELQAKNEELKSTNEELETSKEEVKSANEELITVNVELKEKIEQLSKAQNDINNLLVSTDIAVLFLDKNLKIKWFTPKVKEVFSLIDSDIERSVSDINTSLKYPGFAEDSQAVLKTLRPKIIEKRDKRGRWYRIEIRPYRTTENVIDGLAATFVDVTEQKTLKRMATTVADSKDAIMVLDLEGNLHTWNQGAETLYGYTREEALGMNIRALTAPETQAKMDEALEQVKAGKSSESLEISRIAKNGQNLRVWLTLTVLSNEQNQIQEIATTERDITPIIDREQAYQEEIERLQQTVERLEQKLKDT